jgi:hypothetical protein
MRPTHIIVTHGSPLPDRDLTDWEVQGKGPGSMQWTSLTDPARLPPLPSKHKTSVIALNNVQGEFLYIVFELRLETNLYAIHGH